MPTKVDEPGVPLPTHLDRQEKKAFRRVATARAELGKPSRPAETDIVVDFVRTRRRIEMLELFAERRRLAESRTHPTSYLQTVRAIETATATSRRLAHDLGLIMSANPASAPQDRSQ